MLIILSAGDTHNSISMTINNVSQSYLIYNANESDLTKYAGLKIFSAEVKKGDVIKTSCVGYIGYESGDTYSFASYVIAYI